MKCPVCNGKGTSPNPYKVSVSYPEKCWKCKGTGQVLGTAKK